MQKLIDLLRKLLKKLVPPPLTKFYHEEGRPLTKEPGNSCYDVSSMIDVIIPAGGRMLIPTGYYFEIPEGYEIQVRPRSGLAIKNGITVLNAPGTVDEIYRGHLQVILINHGSEPFKISKGDRIAQICFAECSEVQLVSVPSISENTSRGSKGFGSSGV